MFFSFFFFLLLWHFASGNTPLLGPYPTLPGTFAILVVVGLNFAIGQSHYSMGHLLALWPGTRLENSLAMWPTDIDLAQMDWLHRQGPCP
jgi:hypothetical protein